MVLLSIMVLLTWILLMMRILTNVLPTIVAMAMILSVRNPIFPRAIIKPELHYTGTQTNDHKYKYMGFGHKDLNPGPWINKQTREGTRLMKKGAKF